MTVRIENMKQRDINLDLIRAAALLSIFVLHCLDNSGFYEQPYVGAAAFVMGGMKVAFGYCVPVFLMLTGYLCCNKSFSKSYYVGILKVLLTYIVASLFCIAFEKLYLGETYSVRKAIGSLINFEVGYGWYIMLYVGLFLMIPFLNMMFHSTDTKEKKLALLLTFFALSILGSILNTYIHIWSVWWTRLYPLCYYFTGAYLSQSRPKQPAWKLGLLLLGLMLLFSGYNYLYFDGDPSRVHMILDYANYQIFTVSVLLFQFIRALDLSRMAGWMHLLITRISELSLAAYLCSWITDGIIYRAFVPHFPQPSDRYAWTPLLVLAGLIGSLLLGQVVCWIYKPIEGFLKPRLLKLCREK